MVNFARTNPVAHPLVHMGPEEITIHSLKGLFAAQMATNRGIVVLVDDPSAQVHIVGYHSEMNIELVHAG